MISEWWQSVPGFETLYQVSTWGGVWSMRAGRRLRTPPDVRGYPQVNFHDGERHLHTTVHVIELLAFSGPCPDGMEARHLNDVKTDNRWLINLVWGTPEDNQGLDRLLNGTSNRGERHGMHRLTETDVLAIYARRQEPARLLAAEFEVSRQCIGHVTSGRRWAWLTEPV